ncbi:MAG: hypothetical protein ABH867_00185 [Patescibacteria group bacterium]|nr:hypothetical protein [Patescibacteria group bacterium]
MVEKERIFIRQTPEGAQKVVRKLETKISKEVDTWLEKVEKGDLYLSKPVTDDATGQVLVTAPSAKKPKIVLPLDRQQLLYGLSQKVTEAIRWLAEWCLRLIKMKPEQVKLKEDSTSGDNQ